MKVLIDYADGVWSYKRAKDGRDLVEVPDEVVDLWDAVAHAHEAVQKQLCDLDNKSEPEDDLGLDEWKKHVAVVKVTRGKS